MRRTIAALLIATSACARVEPATEPSVLQQGGFRPARGRVTDHVVVISIDGLRPDAITKFKAPTLGRLMHEGRYSLTAQTISISKTLPSHTSMVTGVDADQHGITWNSDKTGSFGYVKVPTIFALAHDAGFKTAAFFSKTKFNHIGVPQTLDHVRGPKGGPIPWNSSKTVGLVRAHLAESAPNLMFIHLADPDFAGHTFGWMGRTYGQAVRQADLAVADILTIADERFGQGRYTVIVTSDHGGHNKTHGTTDPVDTTIPWIVWGAGVERGDPLTGIRTMDTAATTMWMLGLTAPTNWVGRAQTSAFDRAVASAP